VFPPEYRVAYVALGLANEAGEVAGKVKKLLRGDRNISRFDVRDELGDVLWYLAACADTFELTLEDIAKANIDKLQDRAQRNALKGSGDNR
jgi:NTP pyrophosphatase (non-canonical NTP hydrolase)